MFLLTTHGKHLPQTIMLLQTVPFGSSFSKSSSAKARQTFTDESCSELVSGLRAAAKKHVSAVTSSVPHAAPLFSSRATLYPRLATMPTWCHAAVERDLRLEVSCPLVQRRFFRFPVNLIGALSFVEFLRSNPTGLQQLGCCYISGTTNSKKQRATSGTHPVSAAASAKKLP